MHGDGTKTAITTNDAALAPRPFFARAAQAYRMRWKRRRLIFRAMRSRRVLTQLQGHQKSLNRESILVFCCFRNEQERLPAFLRHYRNLGASAFFFIDNGSNDESAAIVEGETDCAVWRTEAGYKNARFGMDWLNYLLLRYGTGRWCLTVDADELLVYSAMETVNLTNLTSSLTAARTPALGGLMLDLFPKGRLSQARFDGTDDPVTTLGWFDAGPYRAQRQLPLKNLWVQGGIREKLFFRDETRRSPTLNKIPLVKWQRSFAYVTSTHSMLPPRLNVAYIDFEGRMGPSVALLHTKFLPTVVEKSRIEKVRDEHFTNGAAFSAYYDALAQDPDLWSEGVVAYKDPEQLEELGLIQPGPWAERSRTVPTEC